MLPYSHAQEGKSLDIDKSIVISDMMHITEKNTLSQLRLLQLNLEQPITEQPIRITP